MVVGPTIHTAVPAHSIIQLWQHTASTVAARGLVEGCLVVMLLLVPLFNALCALHGVCAWLLALLLSCTTGIQGMQCSSVITASACRAAAVAKLVVKGLHGPCQNTCLFCFVVTVPNVDWKCLS